MPDAKKLIANSIGYTYRDRDSSFLFDFVSLDEFRNLMKDSIYRNGLFDFASTKYDLGTKEEYLNKVREGLINHEKTGLKALQYEKELIRIDDKLQFIKYNDIDSFVYIFGLILLGLLYPIRLLYYLIKWAIKTIKADTQ